MELFLSLIHSLNKYHLAVHYSLGTGLGEKVRGRRQETYPYGTYNLEQKPGIKKKKKSLQVRDARKEQVHGALETQQGTWPALGERSGKASSGNDILVQMGRVINSFYTGKGEVGGESVFPAKCSAHTRTTPGHQCSEDRGKEQQMRQ